MLVKIQVSALKLPEREGSSMQVFKLVSNALQETSLENTARETAENATESAEARNAAVAGETAFTKSKA